MANLTQGTEVQYRKSENGAWKKGVIHGIRKIDADGGTVVGYLVDTGKDLRVDVQTEVDQPSVDAHYKEVNARVAKLQKGGMDWNEAIATVSQHKDLPQIKEHIIELRQPEQIEVLPNNIKVA
jgi:hypothetical protein